ncbi:MAG: efflux transporter outer membrane subunit [Amphiplicatus sp.]
MTMIKTLFASASAMTVAACASVGPDYAQPPTDQFMQGTLESDSAVDASATEPAQSWWTALEDKALNTLIERAFVENRDLRVAAANVEAARAALRLERVNLRPTGEAGADYQRRRLSGASFGADGASFDDTDYFDVGLNAAWELDFFGRVRRGTEAALADAQSAEYLRRDAEALVAAETARAYIDYRGAQTRLAVAKRNLEIQSETRSLTQTRFEEGLGTRLDVARAETQAKTTEASIPPLEAAETAAVNRLATLTGAPVSEIAALLGEAETALPFPPDALAIGDAEGLLKRRADVRAAERTLAAATARIGVAKADYFPRITLVGAVSASAQTLSGVGGDGSFGYGVGPSLAWSGFDIPRVRAQVKAADARADAAFAAYEQTVLVALEETRTALSAYGRERVRFNALNAAAATAREAAVLARERFDAGADDFIDVLDAEGRQLAAEASLAESQSAVASRYINVYLALGAGWRSEPSIHEVKA